MENVNILGYFLRGGMKWLLISNEDGYLKGIDVSPLGKIHTLHISVDNVDHLVLIQK